MSEQKTDLSVNRLEIVDKFVIKSIMSANRKFCGGIPLQTQWFRYATVNRAKSNMI